MKNIWRVIRLIPAYRSRIAGIVGVGLALGAIGTATPYLYKFIVDVISSLLGGRLAQDQALASLGWLLLTFLVSRLLLVLFSALQEKQSDDLWLETVSSFRQKVFDNMTRMSVDYFEKTRVGEVMDRFGHIVPVTMWLFSLTEGTLASLLQMFFFVVVLLIKAPLVGGVMAAVVACNLILSYRTLTATQPYRRGWQRLAGRMSGLLAEMVTHVVTVRSLGGEGHVKRQYNQTQAEWRVTRDALHKLEWRSNLALNVINTVGMCVAVGVAVHAAVHGAFTAGDVLLVLTLSQGLIVTIAPVSRQLNQMGDIETNAERLAELLDVAPQLSDAPDAVSLTTIDTVEFDDVSFSYPGGGKAALHHVSFVLGGGQSTALVGPSGSGKTTIVKLLMRFYDPDSGRILINGRDIRGYRQESVRALMGVVLQDVALFNDTLADNVAFARAGATEEEVRAACRLAHADSFIDRLPDGYETVVGERGVKLSGGEKQRVAIARAILKAPALVILDEATSALDSASEFMVQQGLQQLMRGRGSLVVAHRLSTIMRADQILVVEDGRIVERGRHAELLASGSGLYARLCALQGAPAEQVA